MNGFGAYQRSSSPRPGLRGEVAAKRRVRGTLHESEPVEKAPHPSPLPAKSGARERTAGAEMKGPSAYLLLPSIGVIFSFANSMPSMQLTFSATTSVPSGLLPRANTSTPQSMQS